MWADSLMLEYVAWKAIELYWTTWGKKQWYLTLWFYAIVMENAVFFSRLCGAHNAIPNKLDLEFNLIPLEAGKNSSKCNFPLPNWNHIKELHKTLKSWFGL